MYARLVKGHFKPGKFDLATRQLEDDVIPLLKKQQGFRDNRASATKSASSTKITKKVSQSASGTPRLTSRPILAMSIPRYAIKWLIFWKTSQLPGISK
jgi:hypothetical protein